MKTAISPTNPIPVGDYYYQGDVDDDGWYDFNESIFVTDEMTNIAGGNVPETADVSITLVSPVDPVTERV